MFEFAWPWMFLLLPLPALVWWLIPTRKNTRSAIRLPNLYGLSSEQQTLKSQWLFLTVLAIAWVSLVSATARPQWLGEPVATRSEGREMMLAVDLSGSMEIADMEINGQSVDRLSMVKHVLSDFITRREADRLGLILFGDTAYLQAPMTYDRQTIAQMLNESVLGLVGERTAIGDAIALAVKRFQQDEQTNRVLILLTDGQNTAGNLTPEQALELAKSYNVTIYPIAVGAEEVVVDSFFGQRRVNPSRDLDIPLMQKLASETGGEYFRARSTEELENIYTLLDELEPVDDAPQKLRPRASLFHWPLSLCFIALMALALSRYKPWRGSQ